MLMFNFQFGWLFAKWCLPEIYAQVAIYVEVLTVYSSLETYAITSAFVTLVLSLTAKQNTETKGN